MAEESGRAVVSLTIAIDYDDTFTADPDLWRNFIGMAQLRGHRVVCVSARRDTFDNRQEIRDAMPDDVPVLLSYDRPKRDFVEAEGVQVDIWIDDMPEAISMSRSASMHEAMKRAGLVKFGD